MKIETERLVIRDFQKRDVVGLLEYLSNPRVNCFAADRLCSEEAAFVYMQYSQKDMQRYAVSLKKEDFIIGDVFVLRENEDILYGNGGPTDRVTADKVLAQMRQSRTLCGGLVYSVIGVLGLGVCSTFGAYQQAWLQHYWNTYSCEIMFHELGHVMGYSHSSSFTYGPWAQQLMNNFYVTHLKDFPIDSPRYLESSSNATLYR